MCETGFQNALQDVPLRVVSVAFPPQAAMQENFCCVPGNSTRAKIYDFGLNKISSAIYIYIYTCIYIYIYIQLGARGQEY